jgi:L-fuconolactonase
MGALRRDFMPADLAPLLAATDMDGSIAVQARQTIAETEWLLSLAQKHPLIKGVVGWVDLCRPDVREQLAYYAANPHLRGVRHVLQDEPDPEFMLRPEFVRGIAALAEFDLVYDLLLYPPQLPAARRLAGLFPAQRFVLDHLAKPRIKEGLLEPWAGEFALLAQHPNVYCKLSGMVTEADLRAWRPADFAPYLDMALEAFGPARVMIGSDWPVCTQAGRYEEVMGIVLDYIAALSAAEQAAICGENAHFCYELSEQGAN